MSKKYCTAIAICLSMLVTSYAATANAAQKKGDSDLQLSGGLFHAQGVEWGTANLDVGYGYFFTDSLEVGVMQNIAYDFIDNADDRWMASTIPFVNYYVRGVSKDDVFQPFLGAFIGASYNDEDTTGTIGPQVGFKSFINESTYVVVKYRYEWFFDELTVDDIDNTSSDGNHVVSVGLGFVF